MPDAVARHTKIDRNISCDPQTVKILLKSQIGPHTLRSGRIGHRRIRRLGTRLGVALMRGVPCEPALSAMAVALDWVFIALSYVMVVGCAGWEGRLPWLLWRLLPVFGYGSAVVLLIAGLRARRRTA